MVNLTRIYTRTGDGGRTRLVDMSLTDKLDPRVVAYGDVDEANAAIGTALAAGDLDSEVAGVLGHVQNELFDLGADLGNPLATSYQVEPLRIPQDSVDRLERWCDEFSATLPKLRSFILPGGTPGGAQLHLARTITRRAERSAWQAVATYGTKARDNTKTRDNTEPSDNDAATGETPRGNADPVEATVAESTTPPQTEPADHDQSAQHGTIDGGVNPIAVSYLNRLSDLLFILTRRVNGTAAEQLWIPGGDRNPDEPGPDPAAAG